MGIKKLILSTLALASLSTYANNKLVVTLFDNTTKIYDLDEVSTDIEVSEKTFSVSNEKINDTYPIVDVQKIAFIEDDALKSVPLDFQIAVYPNPTSDILTIQGLEETETEFIVLTETASGKSQRVNIQDGNQINVSTLNPGVYMVVINGIPSFNFIKK